MGKLEDMALLVEVAEAGGLSAAGRRLSLSPHHDGQAEGD
jgi:DNA-binding transcriptional LysR family regulator